ncbi:MAG: PD40 domain-containing protein [Nitrospirae bacterium]|nr:PD40 domain-containing protein [Nitrospirota bacterium]
MISFRTLIFVLFVFFPVTVQAQIFFATTRFHPELKWQTIETDHFAVHFHQGEESSAQRVASSAEEIHAALSRELLWVPSRRTNVILADTTDEIAGYATPFPNNTILLNQTPPLISIPYEDWLRLELTHEYTHILQLDAVHGLPALLRTVLGRLYFPNTLQPAFLTEGLATYEETLHTPGGRGRASFSEMILRTSLLEDRFPSIDQGGGGLVTWPGGQTQYLYGAAFHDYLAKRYGPDVFGKLSQGYSGQWLPFFVNWNARAVLGESYPKLWEEWKSDLTHRATSERDQPQPHALFPPITELTHEGEIRTSPVYSPDGLWIAYSVVNKDDFPHIRFVRSDGSDDRFLTTSYGLSTTSGLGLSYLPDGSGILFAQLDHYRNDYLYSDLYLYRPGDRCRVRLTLGARAMDPDVTRDGLRVVFVRHRPNGMTELAVIDNLQEKLESEKEERDLSSGVTFHDLTHSEEPVIYSLPRWSPDGNRIAVGAQKGGKQSIRVFNAQGEKLFEVPETRDPDLSAEWSPAWSPDGKYLLFSSDRTGIFNLYAYDPEQRKVYQVTHVTGGSFTPSVSPGGDRVIFSNYTARGFDVASIPYLPGTWQEVKPEAIGDVVETRRPEPSLSETSFASRPYSPLKTLPPRFWFPWFGYDEKGAIPGFMTGGIDVLGKHQYFLTTLYGTQTERMSYFFSYRNDQWFPTLFFYASDFAASYTDLDVGPAFRRLPTYWEKQKLSGIDVILPYRKVRSTHTFSIGFRRTEMDSLVTFINIPPEFQVPAEGTLNSLRWTWLFGNAHKYGLSISPEDGRRISIAHERMDPAWGSDFDLTKTVLGWHEYLSLPFRHHILLLKTVVGFGSGDILAQRAFQLGGPTLQDWVPGLDDEDIFLRGYPTAQFQGQRLALGTLEYRFPLLNIERGPGTLPLFFKKVHGALFLEAGKVWDSGGFSSNDLKPGVGGEIRWDTDIGYSLPVTIRLGIARGTSSGGETQVIFNFVVPTGI